MQPRRGQAIYPTSCRSSLGAQPRTMGNAASGERLRPRPPAVDERHTRPQRLVRQLSDLDSGRLRRLIRSGSLAPCFDADDDDRDVECPICYYFYPSLNQSKCCGKGICTECFLQLMPAKASKAVHCPFCKTASYAVEYSGARTLSEKKLQQEEEHNINEAKTRIRSKAWNAGELQS